MLRRLDLRVKGHNPKLVKDSTGSIFSTSDFARYYCPVSVTHCLDCVHLRDRVCPLERALGMEGSS